MSRRKRFSLVVFGIELLIVTLLFSCKEKTERETVELDVKDVLKEYRIDSLLNYDFELCRKEVNNMYNRARQDKDSELLAYAYYYKIALDLKTNVLDSVLHNANQSRLYAKKVKNKNVEARLQHLLGRYYLYRSDYPKSLENYLNALAYFEKQYDTRELGYVNNDLGIFYLELGELDKSLSMFEKSIEYFINVGDSRGEAVAHANLGNLYTFLEKYDLALGSVQKARFFFQESKDLTGVVKTYFILSDIEQRKGNVNQALLYLDQAYKIAKEMNDLLLQGIALINYGGAYLSERRYGDAMYAYQEALENMRIEGQLKYQLNVLEQLSHLLEQTNRYKERNSYLKEYYRIKDSINGVEVKYKIEEVHWNSIFEKQRYENELLQIKYEVEKQKNLNQRKTHLIIVVLVLGAGVTIFFLYRNKTKNLKISRLENVRLEEKVETERKLQKLQRQNYEQETKARSELQYLQRKQHEFEIKSKNDLQILQSQQYKIELESKNRELASVNLQLLSKNKLFMEVEEIIKNRSYSRDKMVFELKRSVRRNRNIDRDWEQFQEVFQKIHPTFFDRLHQKYPDLTKTEIRVCAYIKIKLINHEIAALLNVNQSSLMSSRYRIRKKMRLEYTDDLDVVIRAL